MGIDHAVIIKNYIITIQDKWESKTPDIGAIHKFINCTERLANYLDSKILCGLFISKQ